MFALQYNQAIQRMPIVHNRQNSENRTAELQFVKIEAKQKANQIFLVDLNVRWVRRT